MSSASPAPEPLAELVAAFAGNDPSRVEHVLAVHPELKSGLDEPAPGLAFGATALLDAARRGNRAMIDALLRAGANINARSHWWAGGFGVLDYDHDPDFVAFLIERGAIVDAHAAARFGMLDRLQELVAADPAVVHSRGGDGQTPLHVARTVEIAQFLLDHGADIDARDVDPKSTPAQYMVRDRQDVARELVRRGCRTDILMAAALGDVELARTHLDADPARIRTTVSEAYFPKQNPRAGGTIYIWTLGAYKTAHLVAREFTHDDVFQLLMARSPEPLRLAMACELGDEALVKTLLAHSQNVVSALSNDEIQRLAHAAKDNNTTAVRLMLSTGWPADARGQHGATALHWAAFQGNVDLVREILRHNPPLELRDDDFGGTPLEWGIYGSTHGWHPERGDYVGTIESLLAAGAVAPAEHDTSHGSEPVKAALRQHRSPNDQL